MHVFIAMESDYDGAWIYGVYVTLDGAVGKLTEERGKGPKYSLDDRYMFIEEWSLDGDTKYGSYNYADVIREKP